MNEDRLWLLVSAQLSGEASEEELHELEEYLKTNPELIEQVEIIRRLWTNREKKIGADKVEVAFNRHMQRMRKHLQVPELQQAHEELLLAKEDVAAVVRPLGRTRRLYWIGGVAAALLLVFAAVYQVQYHNSVPHAPANNILSTKPGSKSKIELPDGTQVWLNADSKLTYNEDFGNGKRAVFLTGEAFFDVKGDKRNPFIIHTTEAEIRVLGTTFNVRSYKNEKQTETSLISGSLEVLPLKHPGKRIRLEPDEKVVVYHDDSAEISSKRSPDIVVGKVHYQEKDNQATVMLWVDNKLAFDGETLDVIARKLERWYDVKVTLTGENLKNNVYSGVFDNEDINTVMEALHMTGGFKYSITKKHVQIFE